MRLNQHPVCRLHGLGRAVALSYERPGSELSPVCSFFFFNIYLLIYLAAQGLSSSTQDLCCHVWPLRCRVWALLVAAYRLLLQHTGSSSLTTDRTRAPCTGSTESYPLDHQGSPYMLLLTMMKGTIKTSLFLSLVRSQYFSICTDSLKENGINQLFG